MNDAAGAAQPKTGETIHRAEGTGYSIRAARPEDVETLVSLVRELAAYEKLEQQRGRLRRTFSGICSVPGRPRKPPSPW